VAPHPHPTPLHPPCCLLVLAGDTLASALHFMRTASQQLGVGSLAEQDRVGQYLTALADKYR